MLKMWFVVKEEKNNTGHIVIFKTWANGALRQWSFWKSTSILFALVGDVEMKSLQREKNALGFSRHNS